MAVKKENFFLRHGINVDLSNRCSLECPKCQRQKYYRNNNLPVPGRDLSLEDFEKITNFAKHISFCGQYSDPVHHPQFVDFLTICREKNIFTEVHTASSHKSKEWYINAFNSNPAAIWVFAIDGLPKDSHIYRINQDGEKLFNIMLESKKYLYSTPVWQYIIFKYNENDINKAIKLADAHKIKFFTTKSSRWSDNDPYRPINPNFSLTR